MPCDIHLVCMVCMSSNLHFSNTNFWALAGRPYLELSKFGTVVPGRKSNPSYFLCNCNGWEKRIVYIEQFMHVITGF